VFLSFAPLGAIETVNSLGRPIVFDETLSFLSLCVRGRAHPIALIEDAPMYLDGIIGPTMFASAGTFAPATNTSRSS